MNEVVNSSEVPEKEKKDAQITFRVPAYIERWVNQYSAKSNMSKNRVCYLALLHFLADANAEEIKNAKTQNQIS
jgi:hypothetical protein